MRSIFLSPAICCAVIGSAAADAPFAPVANVPDYVVTMVERPGDYGRRVSHHGDWTRVDRMEGSNPFSTEYFPANGLAAIHLYNYGPGVSVSFVRGGEQSPNADTEPRRTGERQSHLGESCTVWDVRRDNGGQASGGLSHMSCITDDGIELWNKFISRNSVISSAEATRVERRPVASDDVRPPRALLMLDWWDRPTPAPIAQAIPDHETVMELLDNSPDAGHSIRTTRRHDSWQSEEETMNAMRHNLHIAHDSGRMQLSYESDDSGAPKRLVIANSPPRPGRVELPTSMQPKDLERTETVLGESCRWFDMTPGMQDAGRSACLTNDGIVLKEERSSWGSIRWTWTAIRLTRRAMSLDEIKPSPALLEPRLWGIK